MPPGRAVGTSTVSVHWFDNVINAGALERARHRVHLSWTTRCPVCGVGVADPAPRGCAHQDSFVAEVPGGGVCASAAELYAEQVQGLRMWAPSGGGEDGEQADVGGRARADSP